MITAETIKQLREQTGVSVMQCKKALEEAGGDMEKALQILKQKSAASAAKKADRELGAGIIESYVHMGKIGVLVELNCETDFVAKNDEFKQLAKELCMQIAAMAPEYVSSEKIPEDTYARVREIYAEEIAALSKPEEIKEKILAGKVADYLGSLTLLEQAYIKDDKMTIKQLIEEAVQKIGEKIEVSRFVRYVVLEQ